MGGWGTVGCGGYLGLEILARKQIANRLGHSLPRHLSKRTPPPDIGAFPKPGRCTVVERRARGCQIHHETYSVHTPPRIRS